MMEGVLFDYNADLKRKEGELVKRCVKLLGAKLGNEKDISDAAWKIVRESIEGPNTSDDTGEIVKRFTASLGEAASRKYQYLIPNHVIRLAPEIDNVAIGPVQIAASNWVEEYINAQREGREIPIVHGNDFSVSVTGNPFELTLTPVCWLIEVEAAQSNVPEEALWLAHIATSLIRSSIEHPTGLHPRLGDAEGFPNIPHVVENKHLILQGMGLWGAGGNAPKFYEINNEVLNRLEDQEFIRKTEKIFNPGQRSIGLRVAQGLGWLARGRQSEDRAERFLYFFTAIEALLSSGDKTAPVVQTIARHVATIIAATVSDRHGIARTIKQLYATRSALVHTGARNVSNTDTTTIQFVAELLFQEVLEKVSLEQSREDFQGGLDKASYGENW